MRVLPLALGPPTRFLSSWHPTSTLVGSPENLWNLISRYLNWFSPPITLKFHFKRCSFVFIPTHCWTVQTVCLVRNSWLGTQFHFLFTIDVYTGQGQSLMIIEKICHQFCLIFQAHFVVEKVAGFSDSFKQRSCSDIKKQDLCGCIGQFCFFENSRATFIRIPKKWWNWLLF